MSKSLRYVKDFEFPSEFGFSGSAGKQQVKGYARGGKAHGDAMQDRKMVKAAVRKHEKAQHPGEPLTKLEKGGEIETKTERKRYQKKTTGKNSKSVEAGVLEAKKRLETIPYTDAQRAMQAAAAIDIENENRRLEKEIIEGGGELPEYLKKKYGLKRGGGVGQGMMKKQGPQDGSGQRRGKGSFNREPMLKCGGKVKK
jgi:hypothetical protein